jgi:hypothetical protein
MGWERFKQRVASWKLEAGVLYHACRSASSLSAQ